MTWKWTDEYKTRSGDRTWSLVIDYPSFGILSCDGIGNSPSAEYRALIVAAPLLHEAVTDCDALIKTAQDFLSSYLPPDSGITTDDVVNKMLEIFDGPEQRRVQANVKTALAAAA